MKPKKRKKFGELFSSVSSVPDIIPIQNPVARRKVVLSTTIALIFGIIFSGGLLFIHPESASAAPEQRVKTVLFSAGLFSGDGTTGQNSDTNLTFANFNFRLAEGNANIENAFIIFEAQFEGYIDNLGNYTGYELRFDACAETCTADAFLGTSTVSTVDATVLSYDETESNFVRLLLDVTGEAELASYTGSSTLMEAQVGYRINRGTAVNSIATAKATLVITYTAQDDVGEITNTVIYPLESTASGDQGTRRVVVSNDCLLDSTCPTFNYNVQIPELSNSSTQRLSQWFDVYITTDSHGSADVITGVNVEGVNIQSANYVHESAMAGTQGIGYNGKFLNVSGYDENVAQALEVSATSTATENIYMVGGETFVTYIASSSAASSTRTVSFPFGTIVAGATAASSTQVNVFFPENGAATGTVVVDKVWVRVLGSSDSSAANTLTISTKVGSNATSSNFAYNHNAGGSIAHPAFRIFHVVSSTDYGALEEANNATSVPVVVTAQNSNGNMGAITGELMITYRYANETEGYLTSVMLYGGQSATNGNDQLENLSTASSVMPQTTGTKTLNAASLLASYQMSDSDAVMTTGLANFDANLSTGTPICTNANDTQTDGSNAFTEMYINVTGAMTTTDGQGYTACYSNDGGADATAGAKMNGILIYNYMWDAPGVTYEQRHFRFYESVDNVQPSISLAAEDATATDIIAGQDFRLRMNSVVTNVALTTSTQAFKLQFAALAGAGTCGGIPSGNFTDLGSSSSASVWRGSDVGPIAADGTTVVSTLLTSSTVVESYEENNNSVSNPTAISVGGVGEWDWAIDNNSASSSETYCFRMVLSDGTELDSYTRYPAVTVVRPLTQAHYRWRNDDGGE